MQVRCMYNPTCPSSILLHLTVQIPSEGYFHETRSDFAIHNLAEQKYPARLSFIIAVSRLVVLLWCQWLNVGALCSEYQLDSCRYSVASYNLQFRQIMSPGTYSNQPLIKLLGSLGYMRYSILNGWRLQLYICNYIDRILYTKQNFYFQDAIELKRALSVSFFFFSVYIFRKTGCSHKIHTCSLNCLFYLCHCFQLRLSQPSIYHTTLFCLQSMSCLYSSLF